MVRFGKRALSLEVYHGVTQRVARVVRCRSASYSLHMRQALFPALFLVSGCAAPGGPYPSLQPRAAERIDPRVPVERPLNDRPVSAGLAGRLASLVADAGSGDEAFAVAAANAEKLAGAAGPRQSESWIAAQEALTAAIAARKSTTSALADIDEIGARQLQVQGGISPHDLSAIQSAASRVSAIARAQAARIDAIKSRLGF